VVRFSHETNRPVNHNQTAKDGKGIKDMAFNLKTASSRVKKAAYLAGIRSGHWEPCGKDEVIAYKPNGRQISLNPADFEYAEQYTWKEIKSGKA
jgi:hypothetical protein